jgi:hypothetical protein
MDADEQLVEVSASASEPDRQGEVTARSGPVRPSLASLLAEAGVASPEQLRLAVAEGMGSGERLGEVVLRRGWIDQEGLARLLARQWGLAFVADASAVAGSGPDQLSSAEASALKACMIGFVEGVPSVAVAEPAEERFAAVQATLRRECAFVLVTQDALARLLAQVAAAEAQSEPAPAVAADDEKDQTRLLLDELERAGSGLAALRARVEGLLDRCQQAEQELGGCREQLAALSEERERERATAGRRERELAQQRQLLGNVKAKLAEASRALEPDEQV